MSDYESRIKESKLVSDAKIDVTGKIVYIKINFNSSASLVEAESVAVKSLDYFSSDEKAFYDFEYTLSQNSENDSDGFIIMGAKNVNGSNLVWNNNATTSDTGE